MSLRAPGYGEQDAGAPRVGADTLPAVRLDPNAPIEAFGGGALPEQQFRSAGEIGAAANNAENMAQRLALQAQYEADHTQVLAANLQTNKLRDDLTDQFTTLHGPQTVANHDAFSQKLQDGINDISGTLTPRQQKMFLPMATSQQVDFANTQKTHIANEMGEYGKSVQNATIDNFATQPSRTPYDPQAIQTSKELGLQQVKIGMAQQHGVPYSLDAQGNLDQPQGADAAALNQQAALQFTSKLHIGVIEARLDDKNYQSAINYFNLHKEEIEPSFYPRISDALKEGGIRVQSNQTANGILNRYLNSGDTGANGENWQDDVSKISDPALRAETARLVQVGFQQRDNQIKKDQSDQANAAYTTVTQAGPGADARTVIPPQTWANMTPAQQAAAKAINNPPDRSVDLPYATFAMMKPQDVANLSAADFKTNYWSKMSPGDRVRAQSTWQSAQTAVNDPQVVNDSLISKTAMRSFVQAGIVDGDSTPKTWSDEQTKDFSDFHHDLTDAVKDIYVNDLGGKRKPTEEEIQKASDDLAIKTAGGMFTTTRYAFQDIDKIPEEDLTGIRTALRNKGVQVNQANILSLYNSSLKQGAQGGD